MSLGYCGKCQKIDEDCDMILYLYSGENWNDENSNWGDIALLDGQFIIHKSKVPSIEIVSKCKNELTRQHIESYIAMKLFAHLRREVEAAGEFPSSARFVI